MSTVQSQSAIVQSTPDSQPIWNITEVTAYPMDLAKKTIYVFMSPYAADELKAVLKKNTSGYRREKRDVEIVREDRSIYMPLCDAHFVKFGNVLTKADGTARQTTSDEDKAFLDRYPEYKSSIVEFSFGGLQLDQEENTADAEDVLDISAELSGGIKVFQDLYDPISDKVVRINMMHTHSHPTEAQYRQYRGARRSKFIQKSKLWTITEQHGTLDSLYDAVIQSVSGISVNGKPCDAATKASWIPSIPLWHKLWVVDQIFGDLIEKNG